MILLILTIDYLQFFIQGIVIFLPDRTLDKSTDYRSIFGLQLQRQIKYFQRDLRHSPSNL